MDARLQRPRALAFAILALATLSSIPTLGLWPLIFISVVFGGFAGISLAGRRLAAPEYPVFLTWAFGQLVIALAIGLTGGPESFAMSWLLVPLVTLPARFNVRGVAVGVGWTAILLLVFTLGWHSHAVTDDIYGAIFPLAGILAVGLMSTALMYSDVAHRTESVIDGLTGLLNRRALGHRLEELEAQAPLNGQPVAVIAADLDHFKIVNDQHGHAKGDAVLVDVAYRLRKGLRAFDLAYRVGGEEFLILLPGAHVPEAAQLAEELRAAVAAERIGGIEVTMSFGVAGSDRGSFDSEAVIAAADAALYEAKAAGRDRVVASGALALA